MTIQSAVELFAFYFLGDVRQLSVYWRVRCTIDFATIE